MTCSEVREVMRRLWSNSGNLLRHFYALDPRLGIPKSMIPEKTLQMGSDFTEAYHMFFVQTVLVPPNNVRPLSRMGELTFEHPQNTALTQASSQQQYQPTQDLARSHTSWPSSKLA